MNDVVREVNARVLWKGLKPMSVSGGFFEINQLLFTDETALVTDSEEKLCKLVIEFGSVCVIKSFERMQLRVKLCGGCTTMRK